MVRESYAFIALPLMLFAIVPMLPKLGLWADDVQARQSKRALCVALLISMGLVAPQLWRNERLYGAFAPYHSANIQSDQLLWGAKMYRYSTEKIMDARPGAADGTANETGTWRGVQYQIPVQQRTDATTLLAALLNGESGAIVPVLNHMAVGLIHDSPRPYAASSSLTSRSRWALLSTAVVVLGGLGMIFWLRARARRLQGLVSIVLLALSLLYTALVATETRFGILGFAALAIGGIGFFQVPTTARIKILILLSTSPIFWLVLKWLAFLETTRQLL